MQREIKFRVYDYDMKKMRYLNGDHDFIYFDEKGNGYYHNMQTGLGEWFSELMQYTGLKDKNGVEIYEGDIINFANENCVVKYGLFSYSACDEYCCDRTGYYIESMKAGYGYIATNTGAPLEKICEDYEVIGNIYDNKEDI